MDSVLQRAVEQRPGKHVLLVVDRPAHALTHAQASAGAGVPPALGQAGYLMHAQHLNCPPSLGTPLAAPIPAHAAV